MPLIRNLPGINGQPGAHNAFFTSRYWTGAVELNAAHSLNGTAAFQSTFNCGVLSFWARYAPTGQHNAGWPRLGEDGTAYVGSYFGTDPNHPTLDTFDSQLNWIPKANTIFVAQSASTLYYSPDGLVWNQANAPGGVTYEETDYNQGMWAAEFRVGPQLTPTGFGWLTTSDGINWTVAVDTSSGDGNPVSMTYDTPNNQWVFTETASPFTVTNVANANLPPPRLQANDLDVIQTKPLADSGQAANATIPSNQLSLNPLPTGMTAIRRGQGGTPFQYTKTPITNAIIASGDTWPGATWITPPSWPGVGADIFYGEIGQAYVEPITTIRTALKLTLADSASDYPIIRCWGPVYETHVGGSDTGWHHYIISVDSRGPRVQMAMDRGGGPIIGGGVMDTAKGTGLRDVNGKMPNPVAAVPIPGSTAQPMYCILDNSNHDGFTPQSGTLNTGRTLWEFDCDATTGMDLAYCYFGISPTDTFFDLTAPGNLDFFVTGQLNPVNLGMYGSSVAPLECVFMHTGNAGTFFTGPRVFGWDSSKSYIKDDVVGFFGQYYQALAPIGPGAQNAPPFNSNWLLLPLITTGAAQFAYNAANGMAWGGILSTATTQPGNN